MASRLIVIESKLGVLRAKEKFERMATGCFLLPHGARVLLVCVAIRSRVS
jgi:hypothetical protein